MTVATAFLSLWDESTHLDRRSSNLHQPFSELGLPAAYDALGGQHKGARCLLGREQPRQESCYLFEVDSIATRKHLGSSPWEDWDQQYPPPPVLDANSNSGSTRNVLKLGDYDANVIT